MCTTQYFREPTDSGERLDPYDPTNATHAPQCEFVDERDPAVLKILLKVQAGAGEYWWVSCGGCSMSWPVPYYAVQEVN